MKLGEALLAALLNMGKLLLISGLLFQLLVGAISLISEAALASGAAAADAANSSTFLRLSTGLSLSMSPSYNPISGLPISPQFMFTVAIPTLDEGGLFFPILSSPSFYSPSSSSSLINTSTSFTNFSWPPGKLSPSFNISNSFDSSRPFGFSLGFYLLPAQFNGDTHHPCLYGCNHYMAVCAGSLGNMTVDSSQLVILTGAVTTGLKPFNPYKNWDGFAAPVWVANQEKAIRYADQASLMVVSESEGSSTALELQLREGEKVVWRVRNVDTMEMQDTGDLLIYSATNRSHPVWQSSLADSLVEGQSLTVGSELVSNDSSYLARMEQGGLVFYMNKPHFNKEMQPSPYWLFPVPRDGIDSLHLDINQMILSAPCSNSPAHAVVMRPDPSGYGIAVYAGSCGSGVPYIVIPEYSATAHDISWMFWRLENDGMLYSYAVSRPQGSAASVTRKQLNTYAYNKEISFCCHREPEPDFLRWQECNLPMACGPFGLCTPGAKPFCSCLEHFEALNQSDIFQGCKRSIDLPDCTFGKEHTGSTEFVPFNSTASILLFNGWTFNSSPADVNVCKQSCASDCSCNGFFYQNSTSSCFFITDGITLMNVTFFQGPVTVLQDFYAVFVTFIKVKSRGLEANSEPAKGRGGKISSRAALIALSTVILFALVCLVLGMAGYLFRARRKKYAHKRMIAKEEKELHDILPLLPNRFSYRDLFEATEGFTKLLGVGGFGSVYAGVLPDGRKVAVKVLEVVQHGTGHAKQFLAEIATIGRTNHHNIVRLVGFCWEVSQRLLVYEYLERGSLDHWIFVKNSEDPVDDISAASAAPFLDWKTRYSVALGIARGLNYLHEQCEPPILHFDIKPQNILLDNDFVVKLADFGMSRLIERNMSEVVTGMRGTPGYIAPEWSSQGTVSKRSDVYSMGMVLLEIVGGRKNLDFSLLNSASSDAEEKEAWHFPSWAARKCEQGLMMELVDRRLHECGFDAEQALKLIHITFWCIQEDPAMRPHAPTVVQWLEGSCSVEQPPFSVALRARRNPNDKPVPISVSM